MDKAWAWSKRTHKLCPVVRFNPGTGQATLQERENVFNTHDKGLYFFVPSFIARMIHPITKGRAKTGLMASPNSCSSALVACAEFTKGIAQKLINSASNSPTVPLLLLARPRTPRKKATTFGLRRIRMC